MTVAPRMEPRPGGPRDVRHNRWFVDHDDGRVSFVLCRRAASGAPSGLTLAFEGANDEAALAAYEQWGVEQFERVNRNAERRGKWGILGTGQVR